MKNFYTLLYFIVFQIYTTSTQNAISNGVTNSSDDIKTNHSEGRQNALNTLDKSAITSGGKIVTPIVETQTYSSQVSSGGRSDNNVISQPQSQNTVKSPCRSGDLQKESPVERSNTLKGDSSKDQHHDESYKQSQSSQKLIEIAEKGDQRSLFQGSSSAMKTNDPNDLTRRMYVDNNQGLNNMYNGVQNIQGANIFDPNQGTYRVSLTLSGDGVYVNELTHPGQNFNVVHPSEPNSPHFIAQPVMRTQFGRYFVDGYRPNIQYYLGRFGASSLLRNPLAFRVPPFVDYMKPNQMYVNLSEDQLNSYKQYLIQTGLIRLKPYQLLFNNQLRPRLRSLRWMVVPLDFNIEYCKQNCGGVFPRNTLYNTITENASKLPLKFLVPVLKVRNGLKKSVRGLHTVADGVGDISSGIYRAAVDAPSHIAGLVRSSDGTQN